MTYCEKKKILLFFGGQAFSNFHRGASFIMEGRLFNCSEQAFHSCKARHFRDEESEKLIMAAENPQHQKNMGRRVKNFHQDEWDRVRLRYLKDILMAKFQQDSYLKRLLLDTEDFLLAEASPYDHLYGTGCSVNHPNAFNPEKWPGQNEMGLLLMTVRNELRTA